MTGVMNSRQLGLTRALNRMYQYKTEKRGDCLVWTGATHREGTYPVATWMGKPQIVYRLIWEHHNGPIPEHTAFRHTCGRTLCVKISHLESYKREPRAA